MSKTVSTVAVQAILYGIYKALHKIAGASAPAVMRQAAPDILDGLTRFGGNLPEVTDINELQKAVGSLMTEAGCCERMDFSMEGEELTANITDCSFFDLTSALGDEGIPPFGCPFAAMTMALAERNLGKKARVTHLAPTDGGNPGDTTLKVTMAK